VRFEADIPLVRCHPSRTTARAGEIIEVKVGSTRCTAAVTASKAVATRCITGQALRAGTIRIGPSGTDIATVSRIEIIIRSTICALVGADSVTGIASGIASLAVGAHLDIPNRRAGSQTVPTAGIGQQVERTPARDAGV
jgi:hypothetical protein